MCTLTLQKEPLVAKGAITVYKMFDKESWDEYNTLITTYKKYAWVLNKIEKVEMEESGSSSYDGRDKEYIELICSKRNISFGQNVRYIGAGFHASTSIKRYEDNYFLKRGERIIVKGYIPKGSLYYTTGDGLIVTNQMVMKKVIN